jgi:NTP pyrophosphatase (non-canonical NTP hydrolase)
MNGMEIEDFGRWAVAWAEEHGGLWSVQENLVRLAEEVGEVARHVNAQGGRKQLPPGTESAAGEIGDVLFVLALLAHQLDTGLGAAAREALRKQERRGERKEDGRIRDEG